MPLMVEPLAFERGGGGGYESSGDVDRIMGLVRQAVELGADVIKADPTDDLSAVPPRRRRSRACRCSCAAAAASPTGRSSSARETVLEQGAAGIVYGRNVIQHEDPAAMTAALMSVVHDGATADEALARLQ